MNQSAIAALLTPTKGQTSDKRIWGIPLAGVWKPFFTATNVAGDTAISKEALGAPVRLAREKDGTPKLSKTGKPVMRVVKELSDHVRTVRENFSYGLLAYAANVQKEHADEFKAMVTACDKAGEPIVQKDYEDFAAFVAEACATPAEAPVDNAPAAAEAATPNPERELAVV